jgi:xanthine dehydrogenase accessory factor
VLDKAYAWHKENISFVMIVLTETDGSTPRETGASMLVNEYNETIGTIGGGNLEQLAVKASYNFIREGRSGKIRFDLGSGEVREASKTDMVCGGNLECFFLVFSSKPVLILVGGGHVGREILYQGHLLGYYIVLIDDRPIKDGDFLFMPDEWIRDDWEEYLRTNPRIDNAFVVIATRGHKLDEVSLRHVLKRKPRYVGMIGSTNKVRETKSHLLDDGFCSEDIDSVYAPIGLNLGGGRPQDIALSVLAEIQMIRHNKTGEHLKMKD